MSSYFSLAFVAVFLPLVIVVYSALPRRARWAVLLGASYLFFWAISNKLVVFLLASTVSVYLVGLKLASLQAARDKIIKEGDEPKRDVKKRYAAKMRIVVGLGVVCNIGVLVVLKYLVFFGGAASSLLALLGVPVAVAVPAFGIPIGISFYTLQALSYVFDVYRETTKADRNLGRVALFMSFFPQIMEGPICRYADTASQLWAGHSLTRANLYQGSLRMLYGFAKKVIVADRLNAFVKPVFDNYGAYDGGVIALAAVLYTCQLYCDFSGAMDMVVGTGRIFGVKMPENFRQPFFSRSASGFWKRWHITLGTWFRDYVYYPISLSKPLKRLTSKARKALGNRYGPLAAGSIALFCVWLGNGLWHGAGSQYLFFGLYYFVLILAGSLIDPFAQRIAQRMGIDREGVWYRCFQIARTLVVICVGELFFRANGLAAGLSMFWKMVTEFSLESFVSGSIFSVGIDRLDFMVVFVCVVGIFAVGLAKERGASLTTWVYERALPVRWAVWMGLFMIIVVFGAYGAGYAPVDPLYAQF